MISRNVFDVFSPTQRIPSEPIAIQSKVPVVDQSHITGRHVFNDSSEEEIDIKYIIRKKPKTSIVRDFLRENVCSIEPEGDKLFDE